MTVAEHAMGKARNPARQRATVKVSSTSGQDTGSSGHGMVQTRTARPRWFLLRRVCLSTPPMSLRRASTRFTCGLVRLLGGRCTGTATQVRTSSRSVCGQPMFLQLECL